MNERALGASDLPGKIIKCGVMGSRVSRSRTQILDFYSLLFGLVKSCMELQ